MYLKLNFLRFLILLLLPVNVLFAQNLPPALSNVKVVTDTAGKRFSVSYDLKDKEDKKIKVSIVIVDEKGSNYDLTAFTIDGDVGFPVKNGSNKKVVIKYPGNFNKGKKFSVKLIADDLYRINLEELTNQVDSMNLKKSLQSIIGARSFKNKAGLSHINDVKNTIEKTFNQGGARTYRQDFVYKDYKANNVIGHLPGTFNEKKTIIACSHFDTTEDSPGADDNGSGVVGLLEVSRILSKYNFSKSIKFIGFDLEEEGWLGSQKYMALEGAKNSKNIDGIVNMDMIGYYSNETKSQAIPDFFNIPFPAVTKAIADDGYKGNFIMNVSNNKSKDLSNKFNYNAKRFVPQLKVHSLEVFEKGQLTPELTLSDHGVFWYFGMGAIFIGDTGLSRNKDMDTSKDSSEKVNFTFMSNVVKAVVATLADAAEIQHSTTSTSIVSLQ